MQTSIGHLATNGAERWGTRLAVQFAGDRGLSFAEIDMLAGRFAGGLNAIGIRPGDRVVLHLSNGWRWIVAYHALARMGAVIVPANIVLSPDELSFVVINSGAKTAVVEADHAPIVRKNARAIVAEGYPCNDDISFDDLLQAETRAPIDLEPATLLTIGYTSGTTGKPKGAMLSHGNIFSSVAHTATIHVRHENDRVLSALPLAHVYGNVVMNACLMTGAVLHGQARFSADDALQTISEERITLFEGVPTMYYQMLGSPVLADAELSSLTRCTVGGQSMPASKINAVKQRFGCPVLQLWGMTELAGPAVSHSPYWPAAHQSIGLPFPGTEIRIADLENPERDAQDMSANS